MKRSYSGDIRIVYGLHDTGLNDRLIASVMLDPGEYFVLGTYKNLMEEIKRAVRKLSVEEPSYRGVWYRVNTRVEWIDRINLSYSSHVDYVKVVFYRPHLKIPILAVKAEVFESPGWSIERVVSALSKITGLTRFPLPLDYVDQLAYIRWEIRRLIYELVRSKLSQQNPDLANLLLSLVNPQKPL